jgi:hypothetical protein
MKDKHKVKPVSFDGASFNPNVAELQTEAEFIDAQFSSIWPHKTIEKRSADLKEAYRLMSEKIGLTAKTPSNAGNNSSGNAKKAGQGDSPTN